MHTKFNTGLATVWIHACTVKKVLKWMSSFPPPSHAGAGGGGGVLVGQVETENEKLERIS